MGEKVSAGGVDSVKVSVPSNFGLEPDSPEAERRKKLAEWITAPDNPLFARVMMNRLWHYHFGKGLVQTTNDLGFSGGNPLILNFLTGWRRIQRSKLESQSYAPVDM